MSLTGVKSQVDQIYVLLRKMLKSQESPQQIDFTPVIDEFSNLRINYLDETLQKIRDHNNKFFDVATGFDAIFNKTEGIRSSLFDTNGMFDALNEARAKILDPLIGIEAIFNKTSGIDTGLFDSVSGLSSKILNISGSINDNLIGLSAIKTKLSDLDIIKTTTNLLNTGSYTLQSIYNKANSASTDSSNIYTALGSSIFGLSAIKNAIDGLYGGGSYDLLDIYNKVNNLNTTKLSNTFLIPEISSSDSTFANLLSDGTPTINTYKILKFSSVINNNLFQYGSSGLLTSNFTGAVEISYTITANFAPLENIRLFFVDTSGADSCISIISVSNPINAPKTWTFNGIVKTSIVDKKIYKIVCGETENSADEQITAVSLTINQI